MGPLAASLSPRLARGLVAVGASRGTTTVARRTSRVPRRALLQLIAKPDPSRPYASRIGTVRAKGVTQGLIVSSVAVILGAEAPDVRNPTVRRVGSLAQRPTTVRPVAVIDT